MRTIDVRTGRPYKVFIERGLIAQAGRIAAPLVKGRRALVAGDANVIALYGEVVRGSLAAAGFDAHVLAFPAGESSKSPAMLMTLVEKLAELRLARSDLVVALGGGVSGDLVGLAAALYMRGTACLQIPTSLLAMVDSSVGGKTAVNLDAGKNLMGVFSQPVAVICDPDCLATLPDAEAANGWAEIIKYAMIDDAVLPGLLEREPTPEKMLAVIAECVAVKRDIVSADEREAGCRALLNLGHTVGHAVEKLSGYAVPHGRAVGIGLAVITRAMVRSGRAPQDAQDRLEAMLKRFGLSAECPWPVDALLEAARSDKKSAGDKVTLVLPCGWGDCRLEPTDFDAFRRLLELGVPSVGKSRS